LRLFDVYQLGGLGAHFGGDCFGFLKPLLLLLRRAHHLAGDAQLQGAAACAVSAVKWNNVARGHWWHMLMMLEVVGSWQ
jgi:hypothetical protein